MKVFQMKKGVTLVLLVMHIVVATIIIGTAVSTYLNSTGIKETSENVFKAKMQDYLEEFTAMKNYYQMQGTFQNDLSLKENETDTYNRKITNYISSITISDKKFICISNGELSYYNLEQNDKRVEYLEELGINNEQ